jgi:Tfp pilus assembly protein, tip-associated adhesin PilY1
MENQVLEGKAKNQYWLAAKYGGFSVPANYDPYANTTPLPDASWWTNGQTLSTKDKRPDNFFTGGDAKTMKDSLEAAFSAIASENVGSTASLSTNSTQLNSGSRVYQASYKEGVWSGSLKAFNIDATTGAATTEAWDAALNYPQRAPVPSTRWSAAAMWHLTAPMSTASTAGLPTW